MPAILDEMPEIIRRFALYERNVNGRSAKTVDEIVQTCAPFSAFISTARALFWPMWT